MIWKILLIYLLIGWLIAGWGLFVNLYKDDSLNFDDNLEALVKIAYWLPALLIVATSYLVLGVIKLMCFIHRKRNLWRLKHGK